MPVPIHVARQAALARIRGVLIAVAAAVLAVGSMTATATPAAAAGPKVVIVVGPAGASTGDYLGLARSYAAQARSYGASVYEIYTPHATWSRVKSVAQGAKLLIYLGHGNGYPSPYGFGALKSDGLGLNASDGSSVVAYYGEAYVGGSIRLASNAVVILNHLCYASGDSEPGMADPTLAVAKQRADNFAAGFLRAGAHAVFANGHGSVAHIIQDLFKTSLSVNSIFWSDPTATRSHPTTFASTRTPGRTAILDPYAPGKYYHSVVGDLAMTAASWRSGAPAATATTAKKPAATSSKKPAVSASTKTRTVSVPALLLRSGPGTTYARLGLLSRGTKLVVVKSARGNWLYVRVPSGRYGWVAGAYTH